MATDTMDGFMIGTTIWKKIRGTEAPSIMADSSSDSGMPLTTPVKMNTARPAPKPRYTKHRPHGVLSFNISASLERVNMTIWNGTIMLNRNNVYSSFAAQLFTRTIHHAHIEVHTRISATEPTVMSRVQPKLAKKFVVSRPRV